MASAPLKYRRILLKVSGESLAGEKKFGLDPATLRAMAREIKDVADLQVGSASWTEVPAMSRGSKPARASSAAARDEVEKGLFEVRKKIYPRAVTGGFATLRWAAVWITQVIFYGPPWLVWNDRQAVLFDLGARKFYIFGIVFWPQDFIYLTLLLVTAAVSLFLFTAIAGRLWCGYACPQTVYTEIFLWIERVIEGDRNARTKLDAAPLSSRKLGRKAAKHGTWAAFAFWTGFTFVDYL